MTIYDTREGTRLVLNQQKRGHWNLSSRQSCESCEV